MELLVVCVLFAAAVYRAAKGMSGWGAWLTAALVMIGCALVLSTYDIALDAWLHEVTGLQNLSQPVSHLLVVGANYCTTRWGLRVCGLAMSRALTTVFVVAATAIVGAFFTSSIAHTPARAIETLPGTAIIIYLLAYISSGLVSKVTVTVIPVRALSEGDAAAAIRPLLAVLAGHGLFGILYFTEILSLHFLPAGPLRDWLILHNEVGTWITFGTSFLLLAAAGVIGARLKDQQPQPLTPAP